ncbi:hypothetical protein ACFL27_01220 [candidate division CSSED10-310 bacterium]|uniref:Mg chelatase-related protein C-terminal domain-containing protein n=1 Tax=candidate division CSSED10-310 bacterium TaxID=2855610 RepID=A0ABV6YRG8_UNCC1
MSFSELIADTEGESSQSIRQRVNAARSHQVKRFKRRKLYCNAQMESKDLKKYCQLTSDSQKILESAIDKLSLSARAFDRILKVSRTIADLEDEPDISANHISEAIQYRTLDKEYFKH